MKIAMSRYFVVLPLVLIASTFLPKVSHADFFVGVRAGVTDVSIDNFEVDESPSNAGLLLGYKLPFFLSRISLEADFTRSVSDGEVAGSDLGVDSNGLFLAYRTSGFFYLKGRVGLMKAELTGDFAESENGEAYGVALGLRFASLAAELDHTVIDDDVGYTSVALIFNF